LGHNLSGKTFGILGAAFKNGTDDVRKSVALEVIKILRGWGVTVNLYDPAALENAKNDLGDENINYMDSAEKVFDNADALFVLTEWENFTNLDFEKLSKKMNSKLIFDGKNLLDPKLMESYGYEYFGVGRNGRNGH
jgi:UDPglucose 6-dehydrogenase